MNAVLTLWLRPVVQHNCLQALHVRVLQAPVVTFDILSQSANGWIADIPGGGPYSVQAAINNPWIQDASLPGVHQRVAHQSCNVMNFDIKYMLQCRTLAGCRFDETQRCFQDAA